MSGKPPHRFVYMYLYICMHVYICTYIYVYIYVDTYVYIHTNINIGKPPAFSPISAQLFVCAPRRVYVH